MSLFIRVGSMTALDPGSELDMRVDNSIATWPRRATERHLSAELVTVDVVADRAREVRRAHPGRGIVLSRRKRALDVVAATTGMILLSPILFLIAVAVLIDSGWPVLYKQRRIGLEGRPFTLWKFRTMVRRAHEMRADLLLLNESPFPAFKIQRDPRVTRFGRFLRRSSLDELPQLWNVLLGEMSLVGPRPALPEEVRHYDALALRRLTARPGITCTWQIENRQSAQVGFDEWVQKDLAYMENWSLRRDLMLVVRTIRAVARMTGQ